MLPEQFQWITLQFEPEGDVWLLLDIARRLERNGNLEGAATVYDRAYGIEPANAEVRTERARVLDALAVTEHGIVFRYVPAGVFLMGDPHGDVDERPWHPVWLRDYWLSETPLSLEVFSSLLHVSQTGQQPPGDVALRAFHNGQASRIQFRYCQDEVPGAPPGDWWRGEGSYRTKPAVAVAWQDATMLAEKISTPEVRYSLPTEAQWEKAARGGLIGTRHAWGDEPPSIFHNCDFGRFQEFSIAPMTAFAPNGYGLYAMNGCIWEWCRDWYDRDYYRTSPEYDPEGPDAGEEKVLRGGSWADCADVQTVTFRMARRITRPNGSDPAGFLTPNVGFRLCRTLPRDGA
jgi:formylglycine-generating enzyme required for sulfatase activity